MSFFEDASLVMIPSGVKESKLYSIKPTDGTVDFTFTRGTDTATRVNADGLIEKETQNLLLQSNSFSNATWGKRQVSVTPNATTAPDGSNTASKIVEDTTAAAQHRLDQTTTSSSGVKTFSVYLKQGERTTSWVRIGLSGFYIDLTDGTISGVNSNIIANATSLANDWYRVSVTKTDASANEVLRINVGTGDSDGDGTSGIFVWRAQYEDGLVARDYIETTTAAVYGGITDNLPRLDYSGGATCPSLLLEPQRTNLFTQSEYLDGFTTAGSPSPTLTANYAESPEGVDNAYRVEIPSVSGLSLMAQLVSHTSGTDMTISAYVKSNVASNQSFKLFGDYGTATSATLTATSEWQRFTFTFTPTATGSRNAGILNEANTAADLLVYAMQVETGDYATSYIPTMGVSATRAKDTINQNIQTLTSGLTEGTLFIEFEKPNTGENNDLMRWKGSGATGRAFIYNTAAGFASNWGSNQQLNIGGGDNNKVAWRLNSLSSGVEFVNGVKGAGGSGTAWTDIRELRFNADGNGGVLKVKQILFFPTALTDAECITLTTL